MLDLEPKGPQPWTPSPNQVKAVEFLLPRAGAGLFADVGAGKTSIVLKVLSILKKQGLLGKVLIIAPIRVCHIVWPEELRKWTDFADLTYTVLHGKDKDKNLTADVDLYIINPDGIQWLMDKGRYKHLGSRPRLVVDESSKFKHTDTKRFKCIKPFIEKCRSRYILTGTPAPNGLMDLFGQVYIMDLGLSLGRYITHFKNRYFIPHPMGAYTDWTPRPDADKEIEVALQPYVLRMEAPKIPVHIVPIYVELPKKAREMYDEIEDEMVSEIKEGIFTAETAAAASMKCSQIANGGLYFNERQGLAPAEQWVFLHDEKTDAVEELMEGIGGKPLMVAYEFQHDLQRLQKRFKNMPYIGGGVSAKRSLELVDAWNAGSLPLLGAHPASMGHGLNMQKSGNHLAWYGLTWDLELWLQLIGRLARQGAKYDEVFVYPIIAKNTIDIVKLKALQGKQKTQMSLLDALKLYAEEKYGL